MTDSHVTCPNCGYGFENLRKSTRMFDCPSCDTTLFRDEDALKPIGNNGEMHDFPMLFGLGDTVTVHGDRFTVLGHARYDYGRGTWDEFYAETGSGEGAWISVDEGDVVIQQPLAGAPAPRPERPPGIGESLEYGGYAYIVTEADTARCIAVRGQFPDLIEVDDAHDFVNASGGSGELLSGEFWDGGQQWFGGDWLDPFTLKVDRMDGSRVR
jgi:hypothetical protein